MRYLNLRHRLLRSGLLAFFVGCHLFVATASAQWIVFDRSRDERSHDRHSRQFEVPRFAPEPQRTNDAEEQRGRRLSPEERRQLRRDIHDAGRDIYGERPRRF